MAGPSSLRLPLLVEHPPAAAGEAGESAVGPAPRLRYWVETWGCQMNRYDSERFQGLLEGSGYEPAAAAETADVILLNTCSVRERAAEKLFSRLGRLRALKRLRPELVVGVAGCVAQQEQGKILKRSDVVDFVLGTRAVASLPRLLAEAREGRRTVDAALTAGRYDEVWPIGRAGRPRAMVTVIEGCNKTCSFCIVPFTRGAETSRPPDLIEAEARRAIERGALEVELLGQTVNAYRHGDVDFAALLRRIDRIDGLARLRFTTSHPRELTDAVIAAMAKGERVCNHLHLPVQSGSDAVLKRMYRGYDRGRYLGRIGRLRQAIPDIALSTDVIVGFPGESEAEFADTLRLLDEASFDQVFAFLYSPRPFTRAAGLADPVPQAEKEERLQRLFARQDGITRRKHAALLGRTVEVLVEGPGKYGRGLLTGRTTDNRIVNFPAAPALAGKLAPVRVVGAFPHSLLGELAVEEGPSAGSLAGVV